MRKDRLYPAHLYHVSSLVSVAVARELRALPVELVPGRRGQLHHGGLALDGGVEAAAALAHGVVVEGAGVMSNNRALTNQAELR